MLLNRNSGLQHEDNLADDKPYDTHTKLKETNDSASNKYVSGKIVRELFSNRRLLIGEENLYGSFNNEASFHIAKVSHHVNKGERLTLILPGFPAKSPNRKKTLGPMPDLAEKYALENLVRLCQRIEQIYEPGAEIIVCSDGRVFSDLVRIPENDVTEYGKYLKNYAIEKHRRYFKFFSLDDVFPKITDFDTMREELLIQYGESIQNLRIRCKTDQASDVMYKGITRFIFEDYSGLEEFYNNSKSFIQRRARSIAYRVIQRSNAWSRLLESNFDNAVRLSIHPQFRVSKKIGVHLVDTSDCWLTPWHSVAVKKSGKIQLMKRAEAEKVGLLAFYEGRPSHFEILPSSENPREDRQ